MTRCPIQTTALLAQPLPRDHYGNPRYFIPEREIPVEPGSTLARKVGLQKYRGKDRGPGFVLQSYNLHDSLCEVFAALDHLAPEGAPHAMRSDGPIFFVLQISGDLYQYFVDEIEAVAPSFIERGEALTKILIPSGIPAPQREKAVNMLMTFPDLRMAIFEQLSIEAGVQYYGIEVFIWNRDEVDNEIDDAKVPTFGPELISAFLSREEPPAR